MNAHMSEPTRKPILETRFGMHEKSTRNFCAAKLLLPSWHLSRGPDAKSPAALNSKVRNVALRPTQPTSSNPRVSLISDQNSPVDYLLSARHCRVPNRRCSYIGFDHSPGQGWGRTAFSQEKSVIVHFSFCGMIMCVHTAKDAETGQECKDFLIHLIDFQTFSKHDPRAKLHRAWELHPKQIPTLCVFGNAAGSIPVSAVHITLHATNGGCPH
jgi:hypothetical protein